MTTKGAHEKRYPKRNPSVKTPDFAKSHISEPFNTTFENSEPSEPHPDQNPTPHLYGRNQLQPSQPSRLAPAMLRSKLKNFHNLQNPTNTKP